MELTKDRPQPGDNGQKPFAPPPPPYTLGGYTAKRGTGAHSPLGFAVYRIFELTADPCAHPFRVF
jgi:hypothetical protein